jgi:hypothetical protein
LHVVGKAIIHNGVGESPTNGVYGSGGTRIILWPGAPDYTPYSFGIAGGTLWYSVPTGAVHAFYVGTTERMRINTSGNVGIGIANPNTRLCVNTGAGNGVSSFAMRICSGGGTDGAQFFVVLV